MADKLDRMVEELCSADEPKKEEAPPLPTVNRAEWVQTHSGIYGFLPVKDAEAVLRKKVEKVCTFSYPGAQRPRQMDAGKLRPFLPKTLKDLRAQAGNWGGAKAGLNSATVLRIPESDASGRN